jgi:hypothetical protein
VVTNIQIKCVNKSDRTSAHERILSIGGSPGATTMHWKRSQEHAIADIEAGGCAYWVAVPGADSVWLEVAVGPSGDKYIKTKADGEQPLSLLALPECAL